MTLFIRIAAGCMAVAVTLGAMGAHALKGHLTSQQLETLDTAVLYLFVHGLAVLILGLMGDSKQFRVPLWWLMAMMIVGMVLFSGSLLVYVLADVYWMVYVTPFGGATFIVTWILLAFSARKV